jgi:hypothetical protein
MESVLPLWDKVSQKQLEKEVIKRIIIEEGGEEYDALTKQLHRIRVKSREFTGHGFFTEFAVPNNILRCKKKSFNLGNRVNAEIEGFKHGKAGFVLFINHGKINTLEGYGFGDDNWEENTVKKFKIRWL